MVSSREGRLIGKGGGRWIADWLRASRLNDAEMGRDETRQRWGKATQNRWLVGPVASVVSGSRRACWVTARRVDSARFQAQCTLVPYTNQANKGNGCVRDLLMTRDWWTLSAMEIYATMHKVGRS